jgi:hypothetical protein
MTCDNSLNKKECMYRECTECILPLNDTVTIGRQVVWKIWRNKRVEIPSQTRLRQADL